MNKVSVKVYTDAKKKYDAFIVEENGLREYQQLQNSHVKLTINGVFVNSLVKELKNCEKCRNIFMVYLTQVVNVNSVKIILEPQCKCPDTIDYKWNDKLNYLIRERSELDHTLSWLSTLGGAFSALGDYFHNCAETAGKISMHQFQLALRLDDPHIIIRCRLYFALSLIQRKYFRTAKTIIAHEYEVAKMNPKIRDERLIKMCLGIWAKLKYEWTMHKKQRKKKNA